VPSPGLVVSVDIVQKLENSKALNKDLE